MAYRRRGVGRPSGIIEETLPITPSSPMPDDDFIISSSASSSASTLAAAAIRASSAHRDSSISAAYGDSAISSSHYRDSPGERRSSATWKQESTAYEYTSMRNLDDSKTGFWNVLARKAKTIFEEDGSLGKSSPLSDRPAGLESYGTAETHRRMDNPAIQKRIGAMASSLNYIGSTIGKSLEEGLTKVETKAADIISDTRKLHIRRKANDADPLSHIHQSTHSDLSNTGPAVTSTSLHADHETQLKASRDVAMAMAAKAKLLLRELKTVKADLAFSKQRCTQLEEENKILRESKEKGDTPEDDDLIRLQLETLLAEKARLAHENSVYARENRFLREIVEYHQLTMQDVVYLDEGIEEVTEVHSLPITAQPLTEIFTESSPDLAELAELEDEEPELPLPTAPLSPS